MAAPDEMNQQALQLTVVALQRIRVLLDGLLLRDPLLTAILFGVDIGLAVGVEDIQTARQLMALIGAPRGDRLFTATVADLVRIADGVPR